MVSVQKIYGQFQIFESTLNFNDRVPHDVLLYQAVFSDSEGRPAGLVGTIVDISNRKELQEQIWRQANYDTLTGIPNRMMFFDRLQQAQAHAERNNQHFALLFIDLDHFKEVNDTLGHAAGDTLLQEVAQRLGQCLRKTATLARMGGDEFTVILPGVGEPAVVKLIVERLLQSLAGPFYLPEGKANIYCSIGIAFYSKDGKDTELLMKHADTAMYQAKEKGRNGYCFYRSEQISHAESAQPEVLPS